MGFISDKLFGKKYERDFVELIEYDSYRFPENDYHKEWDLETTKDDVVTHFEVKADRRTFATGNICIEFAYKGEDSGIMTTKADYWVLYVVNEGKVERIYLVPTEDLRKMITDEKYHKTINCGDGWKSKCHLFQEALFTEYLF